MQYLAISVKYVSGEREAITLAQDGNPPTGIKTPLINTKGNFTREESIIMVAGKLVAGKEKMSAMEEKQKAAKITPIPKMNGYCMFVPPISPIRMGTRDMTIPKMADASISPRRIVHTATGQEASLSSVLAWVSQGKTTGETAVAVKNTAIPSRPGTSEFNGISLPMEKARNRKAGISIPKMTTGPLA